MAAKGNRSAGYRNGNWWRMNFLPPTPQSFVDCWPKCFNKLPASDGGSILIVVWVVLAPAFTF